MNQFRCPICGQEFNCSQESMPGGYYLINCKSFNFSFIIGNELLEDEMSNETRGKAFSLIAEHLLHKRIYQDRNTQDIRWRFIYNPSYSINDNDPPNYINIAERINSFPMTAIDAANRALINLATLFPLYGTDFCVRKQERRLLYDISDWDNPTIGILTLLVEMGLLQHTVSYDQFHITAKGWERIDLLLHKEKEINQGFVAMAFKDETKSIREAFRKAVTSAGYAVIIMDEFEHNNQIVPEMFYEIEISKFVLVDVTFPNYGAYYEAGYAHALKKEVIVCCRESEYTANYPHFDIAQRPIIIWKDENDLVERIKKRIKATVT